MSAAAMTRPGLQRLRAAGGYLVHLVPEGAETSLCGHKPRNHTGLMKRACWTTASPSAAECEKCRRALVRYILGEQAPPHDVRGAAMSPFAKRVQEVSVETERANLDECLARAHAESSKAGNGERFNAWNRVIHALWEIQRAADAEERQGR